MGYEMTSKERRSLKKIAKRIVIQSECHTDNITEYYRIIAEAARLQFYEDNDTTLDDFLMEQFRKAMNEAFPLSSLLDLLRYLTTKSSQENDMEV